MRANKKITLFLAVAVACLYALPCLAQNRNSKGVDIYFQDLTSIRGIADLPYREFLNDKQCLKVVHIENGDTLRIIRSRVHHLKSGYAGKGYGPSHVRNTHYIDTYIALIDYAQGDTLSLSRLPTADMMYNDKVIQADSAFSRLIYHLIDERQPGFIQTSFPDYEYEVLQKRVFTQTDSPEACIAVIAKVDADIEQNRTDNRNIDKFLDCFGRYDDNTELTEFRNEVLFALMEHFPSEFMRSMSMKETELQACICREIETPIHDGFGLHHIRERIASADGDADVRKAVLKSLEKAIENGQRLTL